MLQSSLADEFTWCDGYALAMVLDTFGKMPGFKLEAAREIRMAAEGRETQRIEIAEAVEETKDDIKKGLWAWFAETEYERCRLFGMPVPEDTVEMAKKMGVPLELPESTEAGDK